ncbi:MAG: exopolyphosphatase [Thermodesulfobacteriota bacterium]|nr:exopolyphosphatase [Thermodesulfobacteriota bacterium]
MTILRLASIDAGTNTFRLLIADISHDGKINPLFTKRIITRMGEGLNSNNHLTDQAMMRGFNALKDFSRNIEAYQVKEVLGVATSAFRKARNAKRFLEKVHNELGITLKIINRFEEGILMFKGVKGVIDFYTPSHLIFDIGGGSTEFVLSGGNDFKDINSLDLGVVYCTEKFLSNDPPAKDELNKLEAFILKTLLQLQDNYEKNLLSDLISQDKLTIVGTAGTATTLAAIDQKMRNYNPEKINNYSLSKNRIKDIFKELISMSSRQRKALPGIESGREDLIISGVIIIINILELFAQDNLIVSDAGLLEGILWNWIEGLRH